MKKIGEQRSKRADAAFTAMGLADMWASLEIDVLNRPKGGHGLEALKVRLWVRVWVRVWVGVGEGVGEG